LLAGSITYFNEEKIDEDFSTTGLKRAESVSNDPAVAKLNLNGRTSSFLKPYTVKNLKLK